ncbi:Tripeptidyl-peptidase sed2 [Trichoderma ghanense]|uniref:tripeptidyl-peptidase II n=1 Tax=Trichoderma ghanense TaxID=65468 RepID=A0ABY2H5Q0_9HYPO
MKSALLWAAPLSLLAGLGACGKSFDEVLDVPEGWTQLNDTVNPSHHIRLSIAVKQPYIDNLEAKMAEKGNRLSMEEVRELQTPAKEDIDNVLHWLAQNNLYGVVEKDFIRVWTTVAKAEPLLKMKLSRFSYEGKPSVLRTTKYTIPDSVADSISFINPITNFMSARHRERGLTFRLPPSKGAVLPWNTTAYCDGSVTPSCISKLYNINYSPANTSSPVIFGVAGFLEENANLQDLRQFLNQSAPHVAKTGRTINVELVNGGINSQELSESGNEAALDVDYAVSLGFPTNVTFYSTGGRGVKLNDDGQPIEGEDDDNEPYLEFFQYLLAKPDGQVPHVLSLSYSDDELSVPRDYAKRVCSLFGLLTARGTSIIFSSGDGGARGGRASSCMTNDGTKRPVTMATFPPTCPWVTSIGAVTNIAEPPNGARFSTGGFSQYFARPRWQNDAVEGYIKALDGHLDGYYNESMRAIPDVSAVGTAFSIIAGGYPRSLQGTSASAPVFASMIALINDARMRAGKKSLGFLNQHLYSSKVRAVLQDITAGQSASCIFNETDIPGGWPAAEGWDAITGLGVPKRNLPLLATGFARSKMPTQHVEPESHALLQDVANALLKARKVVVVTGAGISTNSGIPDFRSENGLYSLIQAQFDAASQPTRPTDRSKADGTGNGGEEPRQMKRRMTSREASPDLDEVTRQLKEDIEARAESEIPAASSRAAGTQPAVAASDANASEGVCLSTPRLKPALLSTPQPTTSPLSSPPREDFMLPLPSWSSSSNLRTQHRKRITDASHNVVSSPLSSPPPVLFDPFQPSSPSDENMSRRSSTTASEAEENPPNAMPASQTSNFGKATLPNMKGKDLFDASIWSDPTRTSVFYQFATSLRQKVRDAEPTSSHKFISHLRDRGKLVRCYTQNIDQIEEKVGLSTSLEDGPGSRGRFSRKATANASQLNKMVEEVSSGEGGASGHANASSQSSNGSSEQPPAESSQPNDKTQEEESGSSSTTPPDQPKPAPRKEPPQSGVECVFLHGSLQLLRCFLCGQVCSWDDGDREVETLSGLQPECPHCVGATEARQERGKRALGVGKLRPDIVLYGEEHPSAHLISPIVTHDLGLYPDMLLILGTSLRVHGLKVLVREFAKTVHSRGGRVVFVNFTKPPESSWGDIIDYWIQWDCDAWVTDLQARIPKLWQDPEPPKPKKKRDSGGAADDSREEKKRPPAQNPVALRDTKVNGAYCTLKILKELRRITHTSLPPPSSLSPALALAGAPPSSSPSVTQPPLSRGSAATTRPKTTAPEPSTTMEAVPRAAVLDPPSISTPRGKARRSRRSAPGATDRPKRTPSTLNPNHGRSKKPVAEAQQEQQQEVPETPSQPPSSTVEEFSSILHSVKSNPRIRKRKMIDGEEFVFPAVGKKRGAVDSLYKGTGDDTKELPPLRPMPEPMSASPVATLPLEAEGSVEEPLASISVNVRAATTFARPEAFYIQDPLVTLLEKAPQWRTLDAKQGEAKRSKRRVSKRFLPMQMETKAQAEANAALALAGLKTNSPMMADVAHSVPGGGFPELASWAATWSCKK